MPSVLSEGSVLDVLSDEVADERYDADCDALDEAVDSKSAGEDSFVLRPWLPVHDVLFTFLHTQSDRGEAVGDQVDPQQMRRTQDRESHHGGHEDRDDLRHVGAEQELDGLADVVVDLPSLCDRGYDRGEVVVGKDHVRDVLRDVRTRDAHSDADVRVLDGGCVVDTVTGHCGDAALALPCLDDAHLVLGLDTGVDGVVLDHPVELLVAHAVQRASGSCLVRAA